MEHIERIKEILSKYDGKYDKFKATIDMLCSKGIGNGVFQDYSILVDVLEILAVCETIVKEGK